MTIVKPGRLAGDARARYGCSVIRRIPIGADSVGADRAIDDVDSARDFRASLTKSLDCLIRNNRVYPHWGEKSKNRLACSSRGESRQL